MTLKRTFLALIAFALLLPVTGCGCRRRCCDDNRSFAPPAPCCPTPGGTAFSPGPGHP
jgi:hypothetical protein